MQRLFAALAAGWLAGVQLAAAATAGTAYLNDGSRLHGRIAGLDAETLTFETEYAGTIAIARKALTGLDSDAPLGLLLEDGTQLEGRLAYRAETERQVIITEAGEEMTVAPDALASARTPGPAALAAVPQSPSAPEDPAESSADTAAGSTEERGADWTAISRVGLSGASGNTDRMAINGEASAERESADERLSLSLKSRFAREGGQETENEIIANSRLERDFSKRWFAFGGLELERDEFEDLNLRSVLTLGTGVFLIEREKQKLKARLGLAYQREDFMSASTEDEGVVSAGYDYQIALNGWLSFSHEFTIFPSLRNPTGDFRFESDAAFDIPVSEDKAWSISFGLRNHFDNRPSAGNESLDTFYTVSLGYDFR